MSQPVFTDDFKAQPFWWDTTPRPEAMSNKLPAKVDVLVIGSGYTGLNCALQTARAGRHTLVIDAQAVGWGCSSRNGGQISGEIKPGYSELKRRHGAQLAVDAIKEARHALDWLKDFVAVESLDCDLKVCGRFQAAHNAAQFQQLVQFAENQPKGLEQPLRIVERDQQWSEIDSDFYHGGLLIEHHCSLDPAKYHQALLDAILSCGAQVQDYCEAQTIERNKTGYRVSTSLGCIEADKVVIATNGYTGAVSPWQRQRMIPIGSYMLATERIEEQRIRRLMPNDRVFSDSRKLVVYFRRSPDARRLLFGGRVSVSETDPVKSAAALRREMLRIFPQLEDVRLSHAWMGFVGFTFDYLPHLGEQDGLFYAMGYCGSGICLSSYFGNRLGLQVLGKPEGKIVFNEFRFQTRPLYTGKPWFLAAAVKYYQLRDRYG